MGKIVETFEIEHTVPAVVECLYQTLIGTRGFRCHGVDPTGVVRGGTSLNWATWGENVIAWSEPVGPTRSRVIIQMEDAFPLTLVDWGRKRRMMRKLMEGLHHVLGTLPSPGSNPAPPPPRLG